jgi:UDP-N-acetylmuramate dehydrogenase
MQLKSAGYWNKSHNSFKDITTISVGGKIDNFLEIENQKCLVDIIKDNPQFTLIGGGSNSLFSDADYKNPVIRYTNSNVSINNNVIEVAAGALLMDLVAFAVKNNLSGFEYLAGIPGSVGGGIVQNAGAYGYEISSFLSKVITLNIKTFEIQEFSKNKCDFLYRDSIFKNNPDYIVLGAIFELPKSKIKVKYEALKNDFNTNTLEEIVKKVIEIRISKGAIFDPLNPQTYSCGSYFKNPIVDQSIKGLKSHKTINGYKLSAGELIEKSGINKGFKIDDSGAKVSKFNTLMLVNESNATSNAILKLQYYIQKTVYNKFSIKLEPEVVFK